MNVEAEEVPTIGIAILDPIIMEAQMVGREFPNEEHPPPSRAAHVSPRDRRPSVGTSGSRASCIFCAARETSCFLHFFYFELFNQKNSRLCMQYISKIFLAFRTHFKINCINLYFYFVGM